MGKPRGGSCSDCPSVCSSGKTEWVDFRNQGEKDGEIWRQILKNKRGKQRKGWLLILRAGQMGYHLLKQRLS